MYLFSYRVYLHNTYNQFRSIYNIILLVIQTHTYVTTYVCLKHTVMFFFSTQGLLENGYMALVILVLFLQSLHLCSHSQDLLVSPLDLQAELIQLLIIPPSEYKIR